MCTCRSSHCLGMRVGEGMFEFEKMAGETVLLVSPARKYTVEFIGAFRNNVVLVSLPEVMAGHPDMGVGRRIHIRFKRANVTHNYQATIVKICSKPYLCLRLLHSSVSVNMTPLARETRLKIDKKEIKVTLLSADEQISVSLVDVSLNGARLVSVVRLGGVNDTFTVNLSVVGGAHNDICLPCKIRYVRLEIGISLNESNSRFHHGVEFLRLTPSVESFLMRLVG